MAKAVSALARNVRGAEPRLRAGMGKWESEVEALNLLLLASNHALAASQLAVASTSFLPAARVLSRSCMESAARALWLLHPSDPFLREARWVVHVEAEADARERLAKALGQQSSSRTDDAAATVREFAASVRRLLPDTCAIPKSLPTFRDVLASVGCPEKYLAYILFSDTTHGSHWAASVYRQHLGRMKEFGEFIAAGDWWAPLSTNWWFLATGIGSLADRCKIDPNLLIPHALQNAFVEAQRRLGDAG
jgi:hypothetical protein